VLLTSKTWFLPVQS